MGIGRSAMQGRAWLLALAAAAVTSGCTEPAPFTGIWKVNCADYWGVQIQPAGTDLYSVTFCGLSGCMAPGTWMPDTPIKGDPLYQVESANRIRIRRTDSGYFTYTRCRTDPAWDASAAR
jgi:hypothetical protein